MVVTQTQLFFGQANTYPTAYSDILEFQNISKFSILPNLNPNFGNWEDFDKHPIHQTYYIDILKRNFFNLSKKSSIQVYLFFPTNK